MKKILLALSFIICFAPSCLKKNSPCEATYDACARVAPASEIQQIETYLSNNGLTATKHCSGIYYKMETQGTGASPNNCSTVRVSYVGTLTDGTQFDKSNPDVTFLLYNLIDAWRIILPLAKKGASLKLYVPPSFGYGSVQNGPIPPNSILIFDIQLLDVQ